MNNKFKTYITGRKDFVDIDTLACAVAYSELLRLQGKDAEALLPQRINPSVTQEILKWDIKFVSDVSKILDSDKFILVDCSEQVEIEPFIQPKKIIEIFDHYGEPESWLGFPEIKLNIQDVGACATLIWEEYKLNNLADKISKLSANLLCVAIASQTLNFFSSVTTRKDKLAYKELLKYASIDKKWIKKYFKDVDNIRISDLKNSLLKDTKVVVAKGESCTITQLELWNSGNVVSKNLEIITQILGEFNTKYSFFTSPSLEEGINYIITTNDILKSILARIIDAKFDGDIGKTDKMWLRKEILKLLKT